MVFGVDVETGIAQNKSDRAMTSGWVSLRGREVCATRYATWSSSCDLHRQRTRVLRAGVSPSCTSPSCKRQRSAMSAGFASLNTDLLHMCLSFCDQARDVVRAGATCKHWRAVASTDRLWRERCVKRWPSTARLRQPPTDHLAFYKSRCPVKCNWPRIDVNRLTLLVDGDVNGITISEALCFTDGYRCDLEWGELIRPRMWHFSSVNPVPASHFEWQVPVLREALREPRHPDWEWEEWSPNDTDELQIQFLRDDGKIAQVQNYMGMVCEDFSPRTERSRRRRTGFRPNDGVIAQLWGGDLDLEAHADLAIGHTPVCYYLLVKLTGEGNLAICATVRQLGEYGDYKDPDGALGESFGPWQPALDDVLAMLHWQ